MHDRSSVGGVDGDLPDPCRSTVAPPVETVVPDDVGRTFSRQLVNSSFGVRRHLKCVRLPMECSSARRDRSSGECRWSEKPFSKSMVLFEVDIGFANDRLEVLVSRPS